MVTHVLIWCPCSRVAHPPGCGTGMRCEAGFMCNNLHTAGKGSDQTEVFSESNSRVNSNNYRAGISQLYQIFLQSLLERKEYVIVDYLSFKI